MNSTYFTNDQVRSSRIIYTPSSFARSNLLYIQEIGELEAIRPHVSGRSDLASYLFFMVTAGSGTLTYNGTTYPLSVGDCVFIHCRQPYVHVSSGNLWSLKWCHFYGSNLPGIYHKYVERGGYPAFRPAESKAYEALLDQLYELAGSSVYTRDMRIYDKLSTLVTMIMEESWHQDSQGVSASPKRDVLEIKDYIDDHLQEHLTLESLASVFYLSKHYLARCFKEQCGVTVNTYIQQSRITRAKHLLRFSEKSVECIAEHCGIPDANYFSRTFKKIEGVSPTEYRRIWRGSENKE